MKRELEQNGKHSNNLIFILLLKYASDLPLVSVLIVFMNVCVCQCVCFFCGGLVS